MKTKNYLCRTTDGGFFLARGEPLQEDKSLALVRSWSEPVVTPRYSIIDIDTGLFIVRDTTKKKCLEKWNNRKEDLYPVIEKARNKDIYKLRIEELENEKKVWMRSGYVL